MHGLLIGLKKINMMLQSMMNHVLVAVVKNTKGAVDLPKKLPER